MPIPLREDLRLSARELTKLASFSKDIGLPKKYIDQLVRKLSKLEVMILDAAMKELDLVRQKDIILVRDRPYLTMLHNVTIELLRVLQCYVTQ